MPALTPHSPRFPPDAFALIVDRRRRAGEEDRFQWFCPNCRGFLHEERFIVSDYRADSVSKAYGNFFEDVSARTFKDCGNVMPKP
jgi:3-hydroxyanthranilate 3,4-dioxygenase